MNNNKVWYDKMLAWRDMHIKPRHFILMLSLVVGIFAAFAAYLLKSTIHFIQHFLVESFSRDTVNYWYLVFPVVGIFLTSLFVRKIVKDDISHGVTRILYAISQRKSIMKLHNVWTSLVGSSVTIGFGGSVGAEAPIVLTGSAIGSNLGKFFKLDQKTLMSVASNQLEKRRISKKIKEPRLCSGEVPNRFGRRFFSSTAPQIS